MALPKELADELRQALRAFRAANGPASVPGGPGRALEAWLALRLARRAQRDRTWSVSLMRGDGSALPAGASFVLPTSQDGIRAPDVNGPGWILIERGGRRPLKLELHLSLQWKGRSDATHECDISVLPEAIAQPLRAAGGGHPRGLPIAAFECKDKPRNATSDEMREKVARLFDLALVTRPHPGWGCRMFEAATMQRWGRWRSRYRSFFGAGGFGVVRVGGFQQGARDLANHYHVRMLGKVYADPRTVEVAERLLMDALRTVDVI